MDPKTFHDQTASYCICIMGDFLYLSVFANWIWYIFFFLVIQLVFLLLRGKRWDNFLFMIHFFAKFKQRIFRLWSSVGKSKTCNDFWYDSNFLPKMSFTNVLCVLSSVALLCSVRAPCQRTADCSNTDLQYVFHRWTISLLLAPKLRIFLMKTILLLTFFTSSLQFWPHSSFLLIIVPRIFMLSTNSTVLLFKFSLVENWYFSVKLTIIALVLISFRTIFWLVVHELILSMYDCVLRLWLSTMAMGRDVWGNLQSGIVRGQTDT